MTSLSESAAARQAEVEVNPEPAPLPGAVPGIGGTVLVSGLLESSERSDQFLFDCVHKHGMTVPSDENYCPF